MHTSIDKRQQQEGETPACYVVSATLRWSHAVSCRLIVPGDTTFRDFHSALAKAFGWSGLLRSESSFRNNAHTAGAAIRVHRVGSTAEYLLRDWLDSRKGWTWHYDLDAPPRDESRAFNPKDREKRHVRVLKHRRINIGESYLGPGNLSAILPRADRPMVVECFGQPPQENPFWARPTS